MVESRDTKAKGGQMSFMAGTDKGEGEMVAGLFCLGVEVGRRSWF